MKIKLIMLIILVVFSSLPCYAAATWEERQEKIKAIVDAEIQRNHELELQRIKAEVLGKELALKASNVSVRAFATNNNEFQLTNTSTQENNQ